VLSQELGSRRKIPSLAWVALALGLLCHGCFVSFDVFWENDPDGGGPDDGNTVVVDAATGDADTPDADTPDADTPDAATGCTDGDFFCQSDGSALICVDSMLESLGPCFLGCNESERTCLEPSNLDTETLGFDELSLDNLVIPAIGNAQINTDTGEILDLNNQVSIRPAGVGGLLSGIGFYLVEQAGTQTQLGVVVVWDLAIEPHAVLTVIGSNALVILAAEDVEIGGFLDGGAVGATAGPGGSAGGTPDASGPGPCAGTAGESAASCPALCSSGGGGGGGGAQGGDGGNVNCEVTDPVLLLGGTGGGICSTLELIPLLGGSGGAGGTTVANAPFSDPGAGGGGGGAIQISARNTIFIRQGGGVTVPGEGGGETISGGGAGGGAGGTILLESGTVIMEEMSFLAANGGGGGGADCL